MTGHEVICCRSSHFLLLMIQFLYKIITLYELFKKKSLTLHRKIRFTPECPIGCSNGGMVDTRDLKSLGHCGCAGSSPASSTI